MARLTKTALKALFENGDIPTAQNFIDLIDTLLPTDGLDTTAAGSETLGQVSTMRCSKLCDSNGNPQLYMDGAFSITGPYLDGTSKLAKGLENGSTIIASGGNLSTVSVDTSYTISSIGNTCVLHYGGEWSILSGQYGNAVVSVWQVISGQSDVVIGESIRRHISAAAASVTNEVSLQGAVVVPPGTYKIVFSASSGTQLIRHSYVAQKG